jgi:protein-tyrosine phosphatase
MVCLGNICRSPMAEGIMRAKLERAGIAFELDSAGTGNYHIGEHPDQRAVKCMKSKGLDISYLRARQISARDLAHYDIIFTMDESNQKNVLALTNDDVEKQKVRMFLNELHPVKTYPFPIRGLEMKMVFSKCMNCWTMQRMRLWLAYRLYRNHSCNNILQKGLSFCIYYVSLNNDRRRQTY